VTLKAVRLQDRADIALKVQPLFGCGQLGCEQRQRKEQTRGGEQKGTNIHGGWHRRERGGGGPEKSGHGLIIAARGSSCKKTQETYWLSSRWLS
jgi:hypothetical protein